VCPVQQGPDNEISRNKTLVIVSILCLLAGKTPVGTALVPLLPQQQDTHQECNGFEVVVLKKS
jgi:hypothetical protein